MRKIRIDKRFLLIPAAALVAVIVLLLWRHPSTDTPANRAAIYTAVFQKMMARRQRPYTGLSIGDNDPDAAMMRSFQDDTGVIPGSRVEMGVIKNLSGFMVPGTGKFAEEFIISPRTLRWYGPDIVSVDTLAHGSPMDGQMGKYTLVFAGGHWSVINYHAYAIQF